MPENIPKPSNSPSFTDYGAIFAHFSLLLTALSFILSRFILSCLPLYTYCLLLNSVLFPLYTLLSLGFILSCFPYIIYCLLLNSTLLPLYPLLSPVLFYSAYPFILYFLPNYPLLFILKIYHIIFIYCCVLEGHEGLS